MTVDVSQKKERQLKNWLGLYDIPYNASQYVLNRINFEALRNRDSKIGNGSASPEVGVRLVLTGSLVTTRPLTIFSVDKQPLSLIYEDLEYSGPGGLMHWLGHVQGDPESFVRLTFEGNLIIGEVAGGSSYAQMSGIIITNEKTIKLRPAGLYDYHILYEVKDGDSNYLLQLNNESINETKARWLEAKGIQRDLLADIPRESYSIGNDGSLTSLRRDLSHGEIGQLEIKSYKDLPRALEVLSPYFALTGSEEFTLKRPQLRAGRDKDMYDFSETINGIPVYGGHLRIFVSKTSHKITHAFGPVADTGFPTEPGITEDDAKALVLAYIAQKYAGSEDQYVPQVTGLVYRGVKYPLRLDWGFLILRNGHSKDSVLVNTETGEVDSLIIIDN